MDEDNQLLLFQGDEWLPSLKDPEAQVNAKAIAAYAFDKPPYLHLSCVHDDWLKSHLLHVHQDKLASFGTSLYSRSAVALDCALSRTEQGCLHAWRLLL
jgi:hypothetical protein